MNENENVRIKKITLVVNGFASLGYLILFFLNVTTLLPLYISGTCCSTNDSYTVISKILLMILLVNLLFSIFLNIKNRIGIQIKLFFKQLFISLFICLEMLFLTFGSIAIPVKYFCKIENSKANHSYLIKYQLSGSNGNIGIYKGNSGLSFELLSNSLPIKRVMSDIEISWIDNDNFNFVLISDNNKSEQFYFSFNYPNKLESIIKEDYEVKQYIKTETYSFEH